MAVTHVAGFTSQIPFIERRFPFSLSSLAISPPHSPPRCVAAFSFQGLPRRATTTATLSTGHCVASKRCCTLSYKPAGISVKAQSNVSCAISMADGQAGDSGKVNLDHIMEKARKYWDKLPQPVRCFPWNQAVENFIQLVFDLTLAVSKYLCIPLLAVSSLSELSYCAHERKLRLVPIPLIIGFTVAGILRETASQLSPHLKDAVIPWHLMAMAIFFLLLKLPGPYYPYWGRIFKASVRCGCSNIKLIYGHDSELRRSNCIIRRAITSLLLKPSDAFNLWYFSSQIFCFKIGAAVMRPVVRVVCKNLRWRMQNMLLLIPHLLQDMAQLHFSTKTEALHTVVQHPHARSEMKYVQRHIISIPNHLHGSASSQVQ
ncbi:hypothetical protein Nepgr_005737 [Nepenthes gracilis]|uniref:Uncharacterized protein n=1 Tax=Nepenthes gracilis TaxID=150966 RepID=A0AAD3XGR2_NEPGR|nr:hypothetical protein Nepgr_005737 [Nepenthes gracilis]